MTQNSEECEGEGAEEEEEEEDGEEDECVAADATSSVLINCYKAMVDTLSKQVPIFSYCV